MNRYPRDLHGHGETPPHADWPGGAAVAVQFVVNYEEGGENCVLHGDPASEAFLSEIIGAAPWPGRRHWNMESIYEYGARAGFWRLHRLFSGRRIPVTVYGVAEALARGPAQVVAMREAGWEIASHALKWVDYGEMPEDDERAEMARAVALHAEVVGERPRGWYAGRCSINTVRLAAEEGGFAYVADSYADDLPYWMSFGERRQLVVPYTLDANDMRFATPQGFNSGDQFFAYLRDTFDVLHAEGIAGAPKMMSVGLHCRLAGRPGRIRALERFLDHIEEKDGVWFARRIDIARHWATRHPPVDRERPSLMSRDRFVERFGGAFERSPWIAEAAFDLELGPAHDTAVGLHNALCRIFRRADRGRRLAALKAHPDLAGSRPLAEGSASEQSEAWLGRLSDTERREFAELNAAYSERFGFPFIIAARDHDSAGVLAAFRRRLTASPEKEFAEACSQVERIALLRLQGMLP